MGRAVALDPRFAPRLEELDEACAAGRYPDPDVPMGDEEEDEPAARGITI
jgi:hypothetical protein